MKSCIQYSYKFFHLGLFVLKFSTRLFLLHVWCYCSFFTFFCLYLFFPGISIFIYAWQLLVLCYCVNVLYRKKSTLTILTGKSCVLLNSAKAIADWLVLIFFICLHNHLSSIIHSIITDEEYRCLKNVIHQIQEKWMVAKFGLVFVLTLKNAFS